MNSTKKTARIAGLLYLMIIIFGGFSEVYVRSGLIVPRDAAATAHNIMDSEWLFRIGIMSDLLMVVCYLLLGLALFVILKPVNKNAAYLMVIFNLVGVPNGLQHA